MSIFRSVFFLVCISLLFSCFAQINAQVLNTETEKEDIKVEVFQQEDYFSDAKKRRPKNIIKINFLSLASGDLPFFYERQILDVLSVEVGIGLTTRDFIGDIISGIRDDSYIDRWDYQEILPGISLRASLRFYPSGDDLEGAYLSPEFRFRKYVFEQYTCDLSGGFSDINKAVGNYTNSDIIIKGGYQFFWDSNIVIDWYLGGGLRFQKNLYPECQVNSIGSFENGWNRDTRLLPLFAFGAKVGFAF